MVKIGICVIKPGRDLEDTTVLDIRQAAHVELEAVVARQGENALYHIVLKSRASL